MLTVKFGKLTLTKKISGSKSSDKIDIVNYEPNSGHSNTSTTDENIEAEKNIVMKNHRITIREVAKDVAILVSSWARNVWQQMLFRNYYILARRTVP